VSSSDFYSYIESFETEIDRLWQFFLNRVFLPISALCFCIQFHLMFGIKILGSVFHTLSHKLPASWPWLERSSVRL